MRFFYRRVGHVKLAIILVFGVLAVSVFVSNDRQKAVASSAGPSASHTDAPNEDNCTVCHSDFAVNTGTGNVRMSGLPQTYMPGQQIPITVTTSQSDGVVYGFQLTAIDGQGMQTGTFTVPGGVSPETQTMPGIVGGKSRIYVEHTVDGIVPTIFGSKSWTFMWTAPSPVVGRVDFYAAGNAANSDGNTTGDYIYTTSVSVMPGSSGLVSINGRVFMSDGVRGLRNATVVLTDPNGVSRSTTTSSFGLYGFANVQSGQTYTLSVQSRFFRFARRTLSVTGDLTNVDFIGLE